MPPWLELWSEIRGASDAKGVGLNARHCHCRSALPCLKEILLNGDLLRQVLKADQESARVLWQGAGPVEGGSSAGSHLRVSAPAAAPNRSPRQMKGANGESLSVIVQLEETLRQVILRPVSCPLSPLSPRPLHPPAPPHTAPLRTDLDQRAGRARQQIEDRKDEDRKDIPNCLGLAPLGIEGSAGSEAVPIPTASFSASFSCSFGTAFRRRTKSSSLKS